MTIPNRENKKANWQKNAQIQHLPQNSTLERKKAPVNKNAKKHYCPPSRSGFEIVICI